MNNPKLSEKVPIAIPEDHTERREWIKYQLKLKGISLASIAKEHQVSRQTISAVLSRQSPRWEFEIATRIGFRPWMIWPERYDAENHLPKQQIKDHA